MLGIIPCCGFGTRLKMRSHESKEMLKLDDYDHLIDFSVDFCKANYIEPLVIVRKAKKDLIKYLKQRKINYIIYDPKKNEEWYHSVLSSKDHWKKHNILILPDTRFRPWSIGVKIAHFLELGNESVFALHSIDNPEKWGIINGYVLHEKPTYLKDKKQWAWGLMGFTKEEGERIFSNLIEYKTHELTDSGFLYLDYCKDITRNEK